MAGIEATLPESGKPFCHAYTQPSPPSAGKNKPPSPRDVCLFVERREVVAEQQFARALPLLMPDVVGIGGIFPRVVRALQLADELNGILGGNQRL